jgi:hypothetical protein
MVLAKTRYWRNRQGYDETTVWWACDGNAVRGHGMEARVDRDVMGARYPTGPIRSGVQVGRGTGEYVVLPIPRDVQAGNNSLATQSVRWDIVAGLL